MARSFRVQAALAVSNLQHTVRRLYSDLVRRRARVRVITAQEPDLAEAPIYTRSGPIPIRNDALEVRAGQPQPYCLSA